MGLSVSVLFLSLKAFSKRKNQLVWVIVINGVLFGLWHSSNLLAGQAINATLNQMVFAVGMGMLFAAVYLYTQSIAVTMVVHFLLDVFSFSYANGNFLMASPDDIGWVETWILLIVVVAVALFLVTGKRKLAIQKSLVY